MRGVGGGRIEHVCEMAAEAAQARGHDLGVWKRAPGEQAIARTAACRRCGRIAYVRLESGLAGAGGDALTEPCLVRMRSS